MGVGERLRRGLYLLGTMLVGEGLASEAQVQEALGEQSRRKRLGQAHKRLGQLLIEMSAVSSEDVERVIDQQRQARDVASQTATTVVDAQAPEPAPEVAPAAPSAVAEAPAPPSEQPPAPTQDAAAPYVASANGNVYHAADCRAASRISPANLVRFATTADAEAAGKRACAQCC